MQPFYVVQIKGCRRIGKSRCGILTSQSRCVMCFSGGKGIQAV
ncbi:hypothetical protein HMPREF9123_2040 [Neisseria bacilliformis ATCC BAA-1200]|uniref:Uncharacterized protein n=1 Tax=Neisseria bacilliformis ATCC BAA-1200 TaxID=888742 RepID=F2BE84_9NEIS|nr:hypothetical protein HMPREF9123_2040 [Neisseria bacilliformis ATCC BAA-1200]